MNDLSQLIQGTDEWLQARCGSLGASQMDKALATIKNGWSASRDEIMADIACEILTGEPMETYQSEDMRIGKEREFLAREAYCWLRGIDVVEVGMIVHPRIKGTHASPDGLIGTDGVLELKCPKKSTHMKTLCGASIGYGRQCMWLMACTGRQWVDLCSFNPIFPPEMQLFIKRIERDDALIATMEAQVEEFLDELDATVKQLRERYLKRAAA